MNGPNGVIWPRGAGGDPVLLKRWFIEPAERIRRTIKDGPKDKTLKYLNRHAPGIAQPIKRAFVGRRRVGQIRSLSLLRGIGVSTQKMVVKLP
jgi:hypothetical protein